MINLIKKPIKRLFKMANCLVILTFVSSVCLVPTQVQAQNVLNLPIPGTALTTTSLFAPPIIRGITVYPNNPFRFDFIIDPGDDNLQGEDFQKESNKLVKYFLSALTIPEDEMWVNLSPYEKDRIIPNGFSKTAMGRDLLAQDYLLKQLTASLMNPQDELGADFWERVHTRIYEEYGSVDVPINVFNKVWIVPQRASVYQNKNSIFVVESYLKVLLEKDYIALEANQNSTKHGLGDISKNEIV
ncbi:MAG: hypothetical protein ACI9F2_000303, partial [Lysobacterales bacterium]